MYFADFETTTAKVNPDKSWVYIWGLKGAEEDSEFVYDVSIESFIDYIFENKIKQIFFHNLKFDGNFIYKWLLLNDFKYVHDEKGVELKNNEWSWICDDRGNIYSIYIKKDNFEVALLCSYKLLVESAEKLGNAVGVEKLTKQMDYDAYSKFNSKDEVPNELLEYLQHDIEIIRRAFVKVDEVYSRKMTRASTAYDDFRKFYGLRKFANDFGGKVWNYQSGEFEEKSIFTFEEWKLVAKSYQGGYTYWNPKFLGKKLENIDGHSYDVNSLYPSVMMNFKLPYGKLLNYKPNCDHDTLYVVHVYHAEIKDASLPLIFKEKSKKVNANYLSRVDMEERVMWKEDLEWLIKYYNIDYSIYKTYYFKKKYIFKDWVGEKQWNKINALSEVERDFHKGILNSLSGKFGEGAVVGERVIVEDYTPIEKRNKAQIRYGKNKQFIHKSNYYVRDTFKHIGVVSKITSLSRGILYASFHDNRDKWIYSDTDSGYYTGPISGIEIDETKFGAWKPESRFNEFKVLRAKCYMYNRTHIYKNGKWVENIVDHKSGEVKSVKGLVRKISGLSKNGKNKVDWSNFNLGSVIKDGKTGMKNVEGGLHIVTSDFKLNEDLEGEV